MGKPLQTKRITPSRPLRRKAPGVPEGFSISGSSSSPVFRPPSHVNPRRGSNGAEPLGREEGSRGTFMEWFPGRAFAFFRRAAKEGRSRRSETAFVQTSVPAVANYPPNILRIRRLSLLFAAMSRRLRRASFFERPKKEAKEMRQREPIPKAVPFGILPHRPGGCGPLEIPRGLRGTMDERQVKQPLHRFAVPIPREGTRRAAVGARYPLP